MGLDIRSQNYHFGCPYSTFNRFREDLAELIGIDLNEMEGFKGIKPFSAINDDITLLLNHSDCDGDMSIEDALKVSKRLKELVPKISNEWHQELANRLIVVLDDNVENQEITEFS